MKDLLLLDLQGSSGVLIILQSLSQSKQWITGLGPVYGHVKSVHFWLCGLGQGHPSSPQESSEEGRRCEMLEEKQVEVGDGHAAPVKESCWEQCHS